MTFPIFQCKCGYQSIYTNFNEKQDSAWSRSNKTKLVPIIFGIFCFQYPVNVGIKQITLDL